MERLPDEAFEALGAAEAEIARAARTFHDALVLACYGLRADSDAAPARTHTLLGNVRTTATEFAHRLGRGGRDVAAVREALREVIWGAFADGGCDVAALRPIVDTLGPLLDAE
jgi:hypothetical protein